MPRRLAVEVLATSKTDGQGEDGMPVQDESWRNTATAESVAHEREWGWDP